ncbi:hypothetical protein ACSTI9_00475, partial [Vibrio parahaemolyticus]
ELDEFLEQTISTQRAAEAARTASLQESAVNSKLKAFAFTGARTKFDPSEKRFILGSEIALAVIVAAAGATRIRIGEPKRLRAELI